MTLLSLIQRASILAGMTFASLPFHSNPAHSDTPQFCVIASNGKTECGTLQLVERACIITDRNNVVCGKFKSAKGGREQEQGARQPSQSIVARKEVNNFVYTLKGCRKSDTTVKCELGILNKGKEREISLFSSLVDATGKSNESSSTDIGGITRNDVTITPGVDYSANVTFSNMSEQVVKAQLLNIGTAYYGKVQFRNVPFTN